MQSSSSVSCTTGTSGTSRKRMTVQSDRTVFSGWLKKLPGIGDVYDINWSSDVVYQYVTSSDFSLPTGVAGYVYVTTGILLANLMRTHVIYVIYIWRCQTASLTLINLDESSMMRWPDATCRQQGLEVKRCDFLCGALRIPSVWGPGFPPSPVHQSLYALGSTSDRQPGILEHGDPGRHGVCCTLHEANIAP